MPRKTPLLPPQVLAALRLGDRPVLAAARKNSRGVPVHAVRVAGHVAGHVKRSPNGLYRYASPYVDDAGGWASVDHAAMDLACDILERYAVVSWNESWSRLAGGGSG